MGSQCTNLGEAQLCILLSCGNGSLDSDEACDDGNNKSADGCPANCSAPCGDGVLDPGELCDDGNQTDGDGCAADCRALDRIALVSPPAVAFAANEGDAPPAPVTVTLRFTYRGSVQLEGTTPSWLAVTEELATEFTAAFRLQVVNTSVAGRHSASVRFATHHDGDAAVDTYDLRVIYRVEPSDLSVRPAATTLDFAATSGASVPPAQVVDVAFNGAGIAVVSAPSWVTASAPEPATSPALFSIAINTTGFVGGRTFEGDVVFATTRGNVQRTATVRVRYHLAASLTDIHFVAPYVGVAGRGGTLRVRGFGFQSLEPMVTVNIGDVVVGPVLPDSTTQITVSYPPLPEGRYPVTINGSRLAPSRPELVVLPPSPAVYQAFDARGPWVRIVYDAERRTIYGANALDQQIERVAHVDGTWSRLPPIAIPQLSDIAMAPDGRSLIVLDKAAISAISLTDGIFTPVVLATFIGDRFCGEYLYQMAVANNGKSTVVSRMTRCGFASLYVFDLRDRSLIPAVFTIRDGVVAGSADGSRIYAIDQGSRSIVFESLSNTMTELSERFWVSSITVSDNASRVIMDGGVFSRSLMHLGNLPPTRIQAVASRDSTRAFAYHYENTGDRLEVYDLTGSVQADVQFPLLTTVNLPDPADDDTSFSRVTVASSPDDRLVFISGETRLLVVPLP
jgi:cysteine-rich repeat protein